MNKHSDIQAERVAWSHFWINKGLIAVEVLLFSTLKKKTILNCFLSKKIFLGVGFQIRRKILCWG